jgi:hypothetical protein
MTSSTSITYAIFACQTYYPAGGFNDLYGLAETFKEALEIYEEALKVGSKPIVEWGEHTHSRCVLERKIDEYRPYPRDWAHIVNLKTQKIVVTSVSEDI